MADRHINRPKLDESLYFGNFDPTLTEYELINLVNPISEIVELNYMWYHSGEKKGLPRGYAFVKFKSPKEAEKVKTELEGKKVSGRKLVVDYANERMEADDNVTLKERRTKQKEKVTVEDAAGGHYGAALRRAKPMPRDREAALIRSKLAEMDRKRRGLGTT